MKKMYGVSVGMMIGATLFVATQALADSVTVNGQTYSCTTRCVVNTTSHGIFRYRLLRGPRSHDLQLNSANSCAWATSLKRAYRQRPFR